MKKNSWVVFVSAFVLLLAMFACTGKSDKQIAETPAKLEAAKGLHEADSHGDGEGEEDGTMLGLDDTFDEVRHGVHLVLEFDEELKAFTGTVENVSDELLDRVRVEVHLSNGLELGPTIQADLQPGESREVELAVETVDFTSWSTHPEIGSGEHDHSHDGEHSHEGEHSHDGEDEHGHSHEDDGHEHN